MLDLDSYSISEEERTLSGSNIWLRIVDFYFNRSTVSVKKKLKYCNTRLLVV